MMHRKGFHHFDGLTNSRSESLWIMFSTLYDGKGDWVELRLSQEDNDIKYQIGYHDVIEFKKLPFNELVKIIQKI